MQKGNSYYYRIGDRLALEIRNGEKIYFAYNDTGIAGIQIGTSHYYFRKNVFGDIIEIMNSTGTSVAKYEYDAWGRVTTLNPNGTVNTDSAFIGNVNPIRYRGYYYDTDTELYYLQSRYYDPASCRFINADDARLLGIGMNALGGTNLFSYCLNNPVMDTDPSGEFALTAILIAFTVGAIAGVVGQFVSDVVSSAISGEWQMSSLESYTGAAIGYGIGGIVSMWNPTLGLAVASGLSTFTGQALEKATGKNDSSWGEIVGASVVSGCVGAIFGHFSKGLRVNGITAGKNSWASVYKAGLTKLRHGVVKNMSTKVFFKGIVSSVVSRQIVGKAGKGLMDAMYY